MYVDYRVSELEYNNLLLFKHFGIFSFITLLDVYVVVVSI